MAPPPPPPAATTRALCLLLRLLTVVCLVISIVVLTTTSATVEFQDTQGDTLAATLHFKDIYAYRYMLAAGVIGLAYAVVQTFFAIVQITSGNSEPNYLCDFYGDKVASFLLATGSAAGFGVTKDLKDTLVLVFGSTDSFDKFFSQGYASASVLLIASVCVVISSVFSSYALPKRVTQS